MVGEGHEYQSRDGHCLRVSEVSGTEGCVINEGAQLAQVGLYTLIWRKKTHSIGR